MNLSLTSFLIIYSFTLNLSKKFLVEIKDEELETEIEPILGRRLISRYPDTIILSNGYKHKIREISVYFLMRMGGDYSSQYYCKGVRATCRVPRGGRIIKDTCQFW